MSDRHPRVGDVVHYRQHIGGAYYQCQPAFVTHVNESAARLLVFFDASGETRIISHMPRGHTWHYIDECDGEEKRP